MARSEAGRVISGAWLKLGFLGIPVGSVDLWVLWMEIVVGPFQVLWRIWYPRVHQGIVVTDLGWPVSRSLGLWLKRMLDSLGIVMVSLVLAQVKGTVVPGISAWSVDAVGTLESRVLPVPLVSVGSVDPMVSLVSVGSAVSNCSG